MGGDCHLLFEQAKGHTHWQAGRQESTLYKHSSFLLPSLCLASLSRHSNTQRAKAERERERESSKKRVYFYNRRERENTVVTHAQDINREVTECHVTYNRTPKKKKKKKRKRPETCKRHKMNVLLREPFFLYPTGLQGAVGHTRLQATHTHFQLDSQLRDNKWPIVSHKVRQTRRLVIFYISS